MPPAAAPATLPPLSSLLSHDPRLRHRNTASSGSSSPGSPRTPLDSVEMSFDFDAKAQQQRRHPPPPLALDGRRPSISERRPSIERRSISSLLNGGSRQSGPSSPADKEHPPPGGATPHPHHEYPPPPPHYHAHTAHPGELRTTYYAPPRDLRPITAPIAPPPPGYYNKGLDRRHSYQPGHPPPPPPPPSDYFSPPYPGHSPHAGSHPLPPHSAHGPHGPHGPPHPAHPAHAQHHGPHTPHAAHAHGAPFYEASHAIPFETGARAPISRTTKACNGCRERKVRCDAGGQPGGGGVCSRCRESGRECKYSATQKKRGPMPGRAGRARRTSLEDGLLRHPAPPAWGGEYPHPRFSYPSPSARHEPYPPPEYFPAPSPRSAPVEWWRQPEWPERGERPEESPRGRRAELYDRDPRERMSVDPRERMSVDPRERDPRAMDPRDPRAGPPPPPPVDPRDPRAMDPRDPRAMDPRERPPMDPRDPRERPPMPEHHHRGSISDPRLSPRARLSPRSVRLSPRELPYYSPRMSPRDLRDPREMPMPPPPHHAHPHAHPSPRERDEPRWDMRPHPAAQWPWRGEVEGPRR